MINLYDIVKLKRKLFELIHTQYLRLQFAHIGEGSYVHPSLSYNNPQKIFIGDNCTIKEGVILDGRSHHDLGIIMRNNVIIRAYSYLDCYDNNGQIILDEFSQVGQHVIIGGNGGVYIGKYVMISGMSCIISATHNYDAQKDTPYYFQGERRKSIVIEDNVWIGSQCMVFNGVTIGKNSVIGAKSLVTKDIPANCLAFGIPAKVQKYLKA